MILYVIMRRIYQSAWENMSMKPVFVKVCPRSKQHWLFHYNDVIVSAMASQITSLTIVYSTVYSRRRSNKTSKLCGTGLSVGNSPHKAPVTRKCFHLMTSSCMPTLKTTFVVCADTAANSCRRLLEAPNSIIAIRWACSLVQGRE